MAITDVGLSRGNMQFFWKDKARDCLSLSFSCFIVLFTCMLSPLSAQITVGRVVGTVKDPSGAVVENARLTLTNEATEVPQTTQSNATGDFVFAAPVAPTP
jgi:hypothetical protein